MKWNFSPEIAYQNEKYQVEIDSVVSLDQQEIYFTIDNTNAGEKNLLPETLQLIYDIESKKYTVGHCTGKTGANKTPPPIIDAVIKSVNKEEANFHRYSDQLKTF